MSNKGTCFPIWRKPDSLRKAEMRVSLNAEKHSHKHRGRSDDFWMMMLMEEVAELVLSLRGEHDDPPELELEEIAGICINWLAKRDEQKYRNVITRKDIKPK